MEHNIYDIFSHFNELKTLHTFAVLDENSDRAKELKRSMDKVHTLVSSVTKEKAKRVLEERVKGVSVRDIADSMGMTPQAVYGYRKKYLNQVEQQIKVVIENSLEKRYNTK